MMKMWAGRFKKELNKSVNDFNSSLGFDSRLYKEDITGSIAHAGMLGSCGIIPKEDANKIQSTLTKILADIESGKLLISGDAEDIHMFIEAELTERIGDVGKKLHTARSRNDQIALDQKLYLIGECDEIVSLLLHLTGVVNTIAKAHAGTIMPGYTHLQRGQPITFGHHLCAYSNMFLRDLDRLADAKKRMRLSPLGSGALAGTTYPIDRDLTARALGFEGAMTNSIDGVSDRDYMLELASGLSILMMHLSRFSEEIILWCSSEFSFIELDDAYSTGSSIMPQKKNPDVAELVRGKNRSCIRQPNYTSDHDEGFTPRL